MSAEKTTLNTYKKIVGAILEFPRESLKFYSERTGITYPHCYELVELLEKEGLVRKDKHSRDLVITVVAEGKRLYEYVEKIVGMTNIFDDTRTTKTTKSKK